MPITYYNPYEAEQRQQEYWFSLATSIAMRYAEAKMKEKQGKAAQEIEMAKAGYTTQAPPPKTKPKMLKEDVPPYRDKQRDVGVVQVPTGEPTPPPTHRIGGQDYYPTSGRQDELISQTKTHWTFRDRTGKSYSVKVAEKDAKDAFDYVWIPGRPATVRVHEKGVRLKPGEQPFKASSKMELDIPQLQKGTKTDIEGAVLRRSHEISEVAGALAMAKPEFFTYRGRAKAWFGEKFEKGQIPGFESWEDFNAERDAWEAVAGKPSVLFRKEMTGVAGGEKEFRDLYKIYLGALESTNYKSYVAKSREVIRSALSMMKRYNWAYAAAQKRGIEPDHDPETNKIRNKEFLNILNSLPYKNFKTSDLEVDQLIAQQSGSTATSQPPAGTAVVNPASGLIETPADMDTWTIQQIEEWLENNPAAVQQMGR